MKRLLRYALVGAAATAIHYALLVAWVEGLGWPAWLAAGAGAAVGAQAAYLGNRWFTFAYRGGLVRSWTRFQLTAAAGALLNMALVAAGVALGLHYLAAQVAATLAVLLLSFAVNRCWTFR